MKRGHAPSDESSNGDAPGRRVAVLVREEAAAGVSTGKPAASVLDTIGNTPLIHLKRFGAGLGPNLLAKFEALNPGGSVKDRAALKMIEAAEREKSLGPASEIIVSTSGNMGIGMAMICAVKGFRLTCVVDPKISAANEKTLRLYGAKVVKVSQLDATGGYHLTRLKEVEEIRRRNPQAVYLDQYDSPANVSAHYETTGPEIAAALEGAVDVVVVAAGTGGTSMGIARYFREQASRTEVWIVDEVGSLALPTSAGPEPRFLNGMGTSFRPSNYDYDAFAELFARQIHVRAPEAIRASLELARTEGILTGGSGGAVAHVMKSLAAREVPAGANVVGVLPDHGARYTDTFFDQEWLVSRGIDVTLYPGGDEAC
jgi:2,3-diaminopropionate biosynthesis protein SbnA